MILSGLVTVPCLNLQNNAIDANLAIFVDLGHRGHERADGVLYLEVTTRASAAASGARSAPV
jgi:hypothetical protein